MKQAGAWMLARVMAVGLAAGVALWGAGCGSDDENVTPSVNNRYALAIGIDNYSPAIGANSLLTCVNDANGFAGELAKDTALWKGAGKTLPASITVLTEGSATLAAVRAKMQELANTAQSGDLVVFYQSSHGGNNGSAAPSTDTFLVEYDAFYEDEVFAQDLALFRDGVRIVVVIDACFSAGMYKGAPVFDFPQRVMASLANICEAKSMKGPSVGWMASSEYTETSAAGPTAQSFSRFTKYLIEGFKSGDANQSGDLTFKELFDYAVPRTQPAHNPQSLNDDVLNIVAGAVDPNAPSEMSGGGGGGGGGEGTATVRVVNQFIYDQTIFIDEVQVGVVPVGQTSDFAVSAGQHTIRAWDSTTGSLESTVNLSDGEVYTFTIAAASASKAKAFVD